MEMEKATQAKPPRTALHRTLTIVGIVLCVVFAFLLACNLTIIVKGSLYPDRPPSVLGITPMVVLSGSMSGDAPDHIEIDDLIFIGKAEPEDLKVGDVIAYMSGKSVVTHRIIEVQTAADGSIQWITKGDANNAADTKPIPEANLIGIYKSRIPGVGRFTMFMQQPLGMLIFVGVPVLGFIAYDILRRQKAANKGAKKNAELEAELERLRALAGEAAKEPTETPGE